MEPDAFARFVDLLPPGAMPTAVVGVIEYLDPVSPSADRLYCIVHAGDAPMSMFVGLLELGNLKVVEHFEGGP